MGRSRLRPSCQFVWQKRNIALVQIQILRGAPTGHSVPVREVRLSAGAGFIVAICGEIMTMPGLPRVPSAEAIMLNDDGQIDGLF